MVQLKHGPLLLDPSKDNTEDLMRIGRAYYSGGAYKSADSVFSIVASKSPDYVPAYLFIARTYSRMDPDTKKGLANPKFEKVVAVASPDSSKYMPELMEAFGYLSYYNMMNDNYSKSKDYYNRMISSTLIIKIIK